MLANLIRTNTAALVTGILVGTTILGTGAAYVIYRDASATEVRNEPPFPIRFVLQYSGQVGLDDVGKGHKAQYEPILGERSKTCDLTV